MAKDILLYGSIWEYNALYFFDQINEATEEDAEAEMTLRINCDGGSPDYGMSIIEKIQELSEQLQVKVGAMAHSMALFILCYIETSRVECIDTTQAVLHRAAYPSWMESSASFPDSIYQQMMVKTNKDLEKAFRASVDVEVLESLPQFKDKNLTLKDVFSLDTRVEILLTASDLKKVGLVSKINKITPTKTAEMKSQIEAFNNCRSLKEFKMAAQAVNKPDEVKNPIAMTTLAELKQNFPALYAQAVAEGVTQGANAEKDRVGAVMVFAHLDMDGAKKIIASGQPMTATQMAEFSLKQLSPEALKQVEASAAGALKTDEIAVTKEALAKKELDAFEAQVRASVGLDKNKTQGKQVVLVQE